MDKKIKIACIGNYPPRECGIATFTKDVIDAIATNGHASKAESFIVAINDENHTYKYPKNVHVQIRRDQQRDYLEAVKQINYSGANVCLLQHEFNIFGGEKGLYILSLISRLKIPLVTTLHTILEYPSYNEKVVIQEICKKSDKVIVMSKRAVAFLKNAYNVPAEKIEVIYHGVPDFNFVQGKKLKEKFRFENKKVLLTFGLLSRNKGIETVIHALPKIVEKHPDVMFVVLGKTHPEVVKISGEEYRNYLLRLVERYKLEKNVYFHNGFVSNQELFEYLSAIDIYITPYLSKAQITSGTLAYAIGAGAAVISTPYWHAEELLSEGRGKLFNFGDQEELTSILIELLDRPAELQKLRKTAYAHGRNTIWPIIGEKYLKVANEVMAKTKKVVVEKPEESIINLQMLPIFSLEHVRHLTDDKGIIKHAKYSIPNRKEGYCLDDNARGLLMASMAFRQKRDPTAKELIPVYLSYIYYMQNADGTFRNGLSYDNQYLDEISSEDVFGRTIWALGHFIRFSTIESYLYLAEEMFEKAVPFIEKLQTIQGLANSIIGLVHYLRRFTGSEKMNMYLSRAISKFIEHYENNRHDDWPWFEAELSGDNGVLPLALFYAYKITRDDKILRVAVEAMEFLEKLTFLDGCPSIIGSKQQYRRGGLRCQYPQQPKEAMALVLMYWQAYSILKKEKYIRKMYSSFNWFLGENDLHMPLYNFEIKGCQDALESYGVNRNQGAESILTYLIAHLTVLAIDEARVFKK